MSAPENNDNQQAQGFVLPKKKRKQISSSVLAGLVLLIIMVGSLYWFQYQAKLKKEMDGLIETSKSISSTSTEANKETLPTSIVDEATKEVEKMPETKEMAKEDAKSEEPKDLVQIQEPIVESVETVAEETPSVSLKDSQPLFENILAREEMEEEGDKKKVVVEFDMDKEAEAETVATEEKKELELNEISSTLMAFEHLNAVKNANEIQVNFALKNLGQVKHRGVISFTLVKADGTKIELAEPRGTYSFRMRVEKKYPLPITAENKEAYDNAYALIVDIKDGNNKVILSKPYKF